MTRHRPRITALLLLAALIAAVAVASAEDAAVPKRASSRIRNLAGRMETFIRADAESVVLDSLAVRAILLGYAEVGADREDLKLMLEKPATVAEVAMLGGHPEGTEVKRLQFEVVRAKRPAGRLRVVGAITLVSNPGATGQVETDVGKRQPFRNELKALMDGIRATLGP
jgi:hypothetical protein